MKVYHNKLYSIPDAAKRAGIPEIAIVTMIINNDLNSCHMFNTNFVKGEDILGLKKKWEKYQKVANVKKGRSDANKL